MTKETENPATDQPDPELMALAGTGRRPSILRPILMIAVIVLGGWIISDWRAELEFFLSDDEPIQLGDAMDFAIEPVDLREKLPHNRLVQIRGIPTQRSQSTRYRFFRLVGSPIFVEEERDDYIEDPIQRELEGDDKGAIDRAPYEGQGRLLKFSEMPQRYGGLRHYYRTRYNIRFCEELSPSQYREIERRKRDAIVAQWRGEYKDATPEERKRRKLTLEPTEQQVDDLMADDPVCLEAWLLQDGVTPRDHWWYLLAALVFAGFMVFNVFMLVKWVRDFARA